MKIEIENGCAIGSLKLVYPNSQLFYEYIFYIELIIPNLLISIWYDLEQNIIFVRMKGSIISMMQFRKYIMLNWPDALGR